MLWRLGNWATIRHSEMPHRGGQGRVLSKAINHHSLFPQLGCTGKALLEIFLANSANSSGIQLIDYVD